MCCESSQSCTNLTWFNTTRPSQLPKFSTPLVQSSIDALETRLYLKLCILEELQQNLKTMSNGTMAPFIPPTSKIYFQFGCWHKQHIKEGLQTTSKALKKATPSHSLSRMLGFSYTSGPVNKPSHLPYLTPVNSLFLDQQI